MAMALDNYDYLYTHTDSSDWAATEIYGEAFLPKHLQHPNHDYLICGLGPCIAYQAICFNSVKILRQHIIDKQEDWLSDSRRYLLGFYDKWVPLHRDISDDLLSVLKRIIAPNIIEETSDPLDYDINIMNMEQYSLGERIIRLHFRDYFLRDVQTQRNWLTYGINKSPQHPQRGRK